MKPTSKKTGMASRNAAVVSAAMTRRGPKSAVKRVESTCAPPEISMTLPSMAPRPTSTATLPSVPPMPAVTRPATSWMGMPAARATRTLTSSRVMKAGILNLMTPTSSRATPATAISKSISGLMTGSSPLT